MARKKTGIEFEGFEEVLARLSKLNGNVKKTTEKALKETHKYITENAKKTIAPHKLTGATEESLVEKPTIEWNGTIATVKTGFNIKDGGLASIFLMYGTPRIKKDQKLYDAFYSARTQKEIDKIQEDIFYEEIRRIDS